MIEWIQSNETIIWWLIATSGATFLISLILVPMLVVRIPADYFSHTRRHTKKPEKYPSVIRLIVLIIKNLFGLVLVFSGVLMLVLPGQGIFTIVVGLMMMNFPGKYTLEKWVIGIGPVLRAINWLRSRAGYELLVVSDNHTETSINNTKK